MLLILNFHKFKYKITPPNYLTFINVILILFNIKILNSQTPVITNIGKRSLNLRSAVDIIDEDTQQGVVE